MPNKYKLTFGADPEFFVTDKKTGVVVPSCRKFGGEKRAPIFISPDGGFLEDGTTLEFNVTPSKTLEECRKKLLNLQLVFVNQYAAYEIASTSANQFTEKELAEFHEANVIGCSPDLFAYGLRVAPTIKNFGTWRFAGGHIHIGISPWPEALEKTTIVKLLDLLWIPIMYEGVAEKRWAHYGFPGLYRETSYGVEYRSPDNFWCNSSYLPKCSSDTRKSFDITLGAIQQTLEALITTLNVDHHGARVNRELKTFFAHQEFGSVMGNLSILDDPAEVWGYRWAGREIRDTVLRWPKERVKEAERAARIAS